MNGLPRNWVVSPIGDLISLNPKIECPDELPAGFVPMQMVGKEYSSPVRFETRPWGEIKKGYTHFANGDVLLAKITPCFENGKAGLVCGLPNGIGAGSTEYFVSRPHLDMLNSRYLYAFLKTDKFLKAGAVKMTGSVGHKRVPKDYLLETELPLAPFNEQKRIADKLDAVLARVDACRDCLDRIPVILKRFRQSVLAAATSGKLTEVWRGSCRIEAWSSNQFGDMYALIDGDRGPNYPKQNDYLSDGYCLFLSTKNVRPYGFLFENQVFVSKEKHEQLRNGTLKIGDVVITTRGTLGNVAIYDHATSISHGVVRINSGMLILREKVQSKIFPEYLKLYIASPMFSDQLNEKQTGSAQPQIPSGILKTFDLPVPSVEEQTEIVRRVESLFAYADRLETHYTTARTQVEKLTPATLAKAFRGELVPQDPNDEPASVLLERIKAQHGDQVTSKPKRSSRLPG